METTKGMQQTNWQFIGDVNLEYGGTFYDLSEWDNGYVNCVRVTDLDSACGFTGAVLIEKVVAIVNPDYFDESLSCCGWTLADVDLETESGRLMMAEALVGYGHYDPRTSTTNQQMRLCRRRTMDQ